MKYIFLINSYTVKENVEDLKLKIHEYCKLGGNAGYPCLQDRIRLRDEIPG